MLHPSETDVTVVVITSFIRMLLLKLTILPYAQTLESYALKKGGKTRWVMLLA